MMNLALTAKKMADIQENPVISKPQT